MASIINDSFPLGRAPSAINMLSSMELATTDQQLAFWQDDFERDELGSGYNLGWDRPRGRYRTEWFGDLASLAQGAMLIPAGESAGAKMSESNILLIKQFSGGGRWVAGIYIVPHQGAHHGTYRFMCQAPNGPFSDGGINRVNIGHFNILGPGDYSGYISYYNDDENIEVRTDFTPGSDLVALPGWLTFTVISNPDGHAVVIVQWRGREIARHEPPEWLDGRVSFGCGAIAAETGPCRIDKMAVEYDSQETGELAPVNRSIIVLASGGRAFQQTRFQTYVEVERETGRAFMEEGPLIHATTYGQQLFIADRGYFDAEGTDPRRPKVLDPLEGINGVIREWFATEGELPLQCPLIAVYYDRVWLAAPAENPRLAYASARGNPFDWDFAADESNIDRAVDLAATQAGKVPEDLKALIPGSDDYLIFGCRNSMWILRGDPHLGGQLDNLSHQCGVIGPQTWCHTPSNGIMFLSRNGIFRLPPGSVAYPTPVSETKIPRDLLDMDTSLYRILMAYDQRERGVWVWVTSIDGSPRAGFYWSERTDSWWNIGTAPELEPTSLLYFNADKPSDAEVLLGCRDGYLRHLVRGLGTDDAYEFPQHCYLGPFRPANSDAMEGFLTRTATMLSEESADAEVDVIVGHSPENAYKKGRVLYTITARAGLSPWRTTQARCQSFYLRIRGVRGGSWSMESILIQVRRSGLIQLR